MCARTVWQGLYTHNSIHFPFRFQQLSINCHTNEATSTEHTQKPLILTSSGNQIHDKLWESLRLKQCPPSVPLTLTLFCRRNRKTNCANCVDCSLIFHLCNGTMFGFVIRIFPRRYMIADESRNKYWHLRISSQHPSPLTPPAALMTNETPFHNNSHWLRPYTSLYIASCTALCDEVACMSWIHFPHNIRSRSSAIICIGP